MEDIKALQSESKDLILKCTSLEIKDEPTSKLATDIGVTINKFLKLAEEKRKFLIQPAQETVKRINAEFKLFTEPLETSLSLLRQKQKDYLIIQQKKQEKEEQEKAQLLSIATQEDVMPDKVKTQIHARAGMSFLKKRWAFKIIDFTRIPDDFKLVNETKVRQFIRDNIITIGGVTKMDLKIDGIEFYQEDDAVFK